MSTAIINDIDIFNYCAEDAVSSIYTASNKLNIIQRYKDSDINTVSLELLKETIADLSKRNGLNNTNTSLENYSASKEPKTIAMEGVKEFVLRIWDSIVKAFKFIYKKIKEFFTGKKRINDKQAKDLKDTQKDMAQAAKVADPPQQTVAAPSLATATSATEIKPSTSYNFELATPSDYLIHRTLPKASNGFEIPFSELVDLYEATHDEVYLIKRLGDFTANIEGVLDQVEASSTDQYFLDKVYFLLRDYIVSDLDDDADVDEQFNSLMELRKHKDLKTQYNLKSTYTGNVFKILVGLDRRVPDETSASLRTEEAIVTQYTDKEINNLVISNIELSDINRLGSALEKDIELLQQSNEDLSRLFKLMTAVEDIVDDINNDRTNIVVEHVSTLATVIKAIMAVIKIFTVIQTHHNNVYTAHYQLYEAVVNSYSSKS